MAERTVTVDGRTEEEFRLDINRAIADTEDEIFREAMGDQELDNDGDDSLEQMDEHPLDEELEAAPEDQEQEQELEAPEAETEEGPEAEEEIEGEPEEAEPPEQEPERRGIPSYRVREEAEGRRQAEERAIAAERELAQLRGRMDELSARVNAQPQPQPQRPPVPPPKPDRYTDEAAYDEWMLAEGERRAEAKFNQRFTQMQQDQQAQMAQRVESSFAQAANGDRRLEFLDAYDRLTHLDHRDANHRATVMGIASAPDPAAALFSWFEGYQQPRLAPQRRGAPPPREPQHEVRMPTRPPRGGPPSLNSMGGGGPGQRVDPDLYDDSDAAVFRYATR